MVGERFERLTDPIVEGYRPESGKRSGLSRLIPRFSSHPFTPLRTQSRVLASPPETAVLPPVVERVADPRRLLEFPTTRLVP